jgi:hypothetical protein
MNYVTIGTLCLVGKHHACTLIEPHRSPHVYEEDYVASQTPAKGLSDYAALKCCNSLSMPAALCRVSWNSDSHTESATIPPPAQQRISFFE